MEGKIFLKLIATYCQSLFELICIKTTINSCLLKLLHLAVEGNKNELIITQNWAKSFKNFHHKIVENLTKLLLRQERGNFFVLFSCTIKITTKSSFLLLCFLNLELKVYFISFFLI